MDLNLSQILLSALDFVPTGTLACNGQLVSTTQWPALFNTFGTNFGGNGTTNFAMPNIAPKQGAPGQAFNWLIVAEGPSYSSGSEGLVGEVRLFILPPEPGSPLAQTWSLCDGSLLNPANNGALFSLIGTTFGGNGTTTFALPKLAPPDLGNGQKGGFYIAKDGIYPRTSCDAATPVYNGDTFYDSYLGTILQVPYPPPNPNALCGFALCQGQTLPIATWTALFSLLGIRFGGNGTANFLLPNFPVADGITYALLYDGIYPPRS